MHTRFSILTSVKIIWFGGACKESHGNAILYTEIGEPLPDRFINKGNQVAQNVIEIIPNLPNLEQIDMQDCPINFSSEFVMALAKCPNLHTFDCDFVTETTANLESFQSLFHANNKIEHFNVSHGINVSFFRTFLQNLTKLRTPIYVSSENSPLPTISKFIREYAVNLTEYEHIGSIFHTDLYTPDEVEEFYDAIAAKPGKPLIKLDTGHHFMCPVSKIKPILSGCPMLESLQLRLEDEWKAEGFIQFGQNLQRLAISNHKPLPKLFKVVVELGYGIKKLECFEYDCFSPQTAFYYLRKSKSLQFCADGVTTEIADFVVCAEGHDYYKYYVLNNKIAHVVQKTQEDYNTKRKRKFTLYD